MSMKMDEFVRMVESVAPPELAYEWDNTGLLLRLRDEVDSVYITLDLTPLAIDEAIAFGCDMILTHHPALFTPVSALNCHGASDALILRLIKEGLSLYSAHTSFDRAPGGIGDLLAARLGLCRVETISGSGDGLMRVGFFPKPYSRPELAAHIKSVLGTQRLRLSRTDTGLIDKAAVVGGSGGDFINAAIEAGVKVLITGEAKHHHFLDAAMQGLLLIEAGHFDTERYFVDGIFMSLQSCLNEVQSSLGLKKSECLQSPYEYV